jgi:hypothetical protein
VDPEGQARRAECGEKTDQHHEHGDDWQGSPSAALIPISFRRCATVNDIIAETPAEQSRSTAALRPSHSSRHRARSARGTMVENAAISRTSNRKFTSRSAS